MDKNVFAFWRGINYELIDILIKLMNIHSNDGANYRFILLNENTVKDWIDVPDYFDLMQVAHQADYIRVNVICKYGGIWLDADTIVMDSLKDLFDILETKSAFYVTEENRIFINGVFGSVKNHKVISEIKCQMDKVLNLKRHKLEWTDIGSSIFHKVICENLSDVFILQGLDTVYPVSWQNAANRYLFSNYETYNLYIRKFQPVIILVNSVYKNYSKQNSIFSRIPLNYFLQKSISNSYIYGCKSSFSTIYSLNLWNNNEISIPRSGPGSSLDNAADTIFFINNIVNKYDIKSVVDLGCGDLTWMNRTLAFKKDYIGIDISEEIIELNQKNYTDKTFMVKSIIIDDIPKADLFIIRDVIFHLLNKEILQLFDNIKNKYKYLLITNNHNVTINSDKFDIYHFSKRNLFIEPFNKDRTYILEQIQEDNQDREVLLVTNNF